MDEVFTMLVGVLIGLLIALYEIDNQPPLN
jgi:hypothetical protein